MVEEGVMMSKKKDKVFIQIQNRKTLQLDSIANTPTTNSNLIFLSQLQEVVIIFHDMPDYIPLKKSSKKIGTISRF